MAAARISAFHTSRVMAEKFTPEQVIRAVRGSRGIVAAVARSLSCDRKTVYNYRHRYPEVAEAIADEREGLLDSAEQTLYRKAIEEADTKSLIFLLKTIGKDRGYVERHQQEVSGPDGGPVEVAEMSDSELRKRARSLTNRVAAIARTNGSGANGDG